MPAETMKLILLFCTIILATRAVAEMEVVDGQDYEASKDSEEPLHRYARSDRMDIEARRRSSVDKNFMRFGRADKNILRFGRSNPQNILRFGRSGDNFMRFGRSDDKSLTRLGRPDNSNFIRFGRNYEPSLRRKKANEMDWNDAKPDNFMRFGRNQKTNFLRLGRAEDKSGAQTNPQNRNILRFGRSDPFMRFGRSDSAAIEAESESSEDIAENLKPLLDVLPSLADEDDLIVIPPNYLIAKDSDK
ncbi:FMRFamide-like neuropeptides 1 [Phlebotomus argentipes]|uniref:FMRFamide-like neuropeptides 1 n=1 Tax=Phlebotomus argentipes TaxID=94469 RepID=UPI0028935245|nr:FMRFamide-like neuropeptides 1 [Phlebotomus argentipes]